MPQLVIWGGRLLLAYAGFSALGYGVGNKVGQGTAKAVPYALGAGALYFALKAKK